MTRARDPLGPAFTKMPFMKMHGLGNDFVVLDRRGQDPFVSPRLVRALGDRHRGVGFDQLAVIGDDGQGGDGAADARLTFWNADGSASSTCGNATRCIARLLLDETGRDRVRLRTERGILMAEDAGDGLTRVNLGAPLLDWREVPLARAMDTLHLPIEGDPCAVGLGNPHCVFVVPDADAVDVATLGLAHEHDPLFPERTNVEFVTILSPASLRLRIWERGTGITLASGSCATAAAVAAARRGLTGRQVAVHMDGGRIDIDWRDDGVWMSGPTVHAFDGWLTPAFLEAL